MPTYEYICSACNNEWEEVQKISEPALEVCPKCGKRTAHRQISGGSFILKGGGWYSDSYSSPKPSSKSGEGESKASKDDAGGSKGEGKAKDSVAPAKSESTAPKAPAGSSGGESK